MKKLQSLRALLSLVVPHRGRLALAVVFLFLGSGLTLALPQGIKLAIDGIGDRGGLAQGDTGSLDTIAAGLLVIFAVQSAAIWIRHYLMSWLGERVVADLRRKVSAHLLRLSPAWFHERSTGELVGRIAGDVTIVEGAVGSELSIALRNVVQLTGGLGLLIFVDRELTLVMVMVVPFITLAIARFGRLIRERSKGVQDALAGTNARMQETLAAIVTVQAFSQEDAESARYEAGVERAFDAAMNLARWRSTFITLASFLGFSAVGLVVWVGGRRVAEGEMSAGSLSAFLLYTLMVAASLGSLSSVWAGLMRAAGATERLFEILATISEIQSPVESTPLPRGTPSVELDQVHFHYATRPNDPVLGRGEQGLDLRIAPVERVALVGPSGPGKSTLSALIPRFYDVNAGALRVNGVDVRELDLDELRARIAIVPQDPVLFSASVAEKVAFGRPEATQAEIEDACRRAHAHDFILGFPAGYETPCGERGVQLSGGQRQRVAIARALLADPEILILDEATSSLDAESEAAVQAALDTLMRGRTTLVIAHRLSTVRDLDRIVVLQDGMVAEQGTHEELMDARGLYWRLVERQLEG